jgi:type III restriction enzyme
MVRAPLARRIEESVELNACHVFLPHYDRAAVEAVVRYLASTGNQAVAETMELGSSSVTLPLREMPTAIAAIEGVPTYVVPSRPQRSNLRFLAKVARFLSASGIDEAAKQREAADGAALLIEQQRALAIDDRFLKEVDEQGEIITELAEALMGEAGLASSGTRRLQATDETIDREFAQARTKVTPEIADAYVHRRLDDGASIRQAKLEARALSARPSILAKLEAWASGRIDALRQAHGARIETLDPKLKAKYFDDILQQAPDPTPRVMHLLPTAEFRIGDDTMPRHLYGEPDNDPALALGSSWERETLASELDETNAIAWLRNVDRAVWSLRVPRREGNGWRPFYPDFLAVHQDGDRVVVDILEPHDHTKPDAVSKAKGLSFYARQHAERVRHVDLIAKIDGRYRRLHLERVAVRNRVDSISTNAELDFLLREN